MDVEWNVILSYYGWSKYVSILYGFEESSTKLIDRDLKDYADGEIEHRRSILNWSANQWSDPMTILKSN